MSEHPVMAPPQHHDTTDPLQTLHNTVRTDALGMQWQQLSLSLSLSLSGSEYCMPTAASSSLLPPINRRSLSIRAQRDPFV